jgi:hypothetical protein
MRIAYRHKLFPHPTSGEDVVFTFWIDSETSTIHILLFLHFHILILMTSLGKRRWSRRELHPQLRILHHGLQVQRNSAVTVPASRHSVEHRGRAHSAVLRTDYSAQSTTLRASASH